MIVNLYYNCSSFLMLFDVKTSFVIGYSRYSVNVVLPNLLGQTV